jgi:hypothetical protein
MRHEDDPTFAPIGVLDHAAGRVGDLAAAGNSLLGSTHILTEARVQQNRASRNGDQKGERDTRQIPPNGVPQAFHFPSAGTIAGTRQTLSEPERRRPMTGFGVITRSGRDPRA